MRLPSVEFAAPPASERPCRPITPLRRRERLHDAVHRKLLAVLQDSMVEHEAERAIRFMPGPSARPAPTAALVRGIGFDVLSRGSDDGITGLRPAGVKRLSQNGAYRGAASEGFCTLGGSRSCLVRTPSACRYQRCREYPAGRCKLAERDMVQNRLSHSFRFRRLSAAVTSPRL
jgi:hypothetical protein